MQYWKGQRVLVGGVALGTVYQDQGLNQFVYVNLDTEGNVVTSYDPRELALIESKDQENVMSQFLHRRYWP